MVLDIRNELPPSTPSGSGFVLQSTDGKTTYTEPSIIATYLSELATDKTITTQLLGATAGDRLALLQWLFWNQTRFDPATKKASKAALGGQTYGPEQKTAAGELVGLVDYLDKELRDEQWNGRESLVDTREAVGPSLADISVASTLLYAWTTTIDEDSRADFQGALKLYQRVSRTDGLGELFPEEDSLGEADLEYP